MKSPHIVTLSQQLEPGFSPVSRRRGQNYYREGRVRIEHGSENYVEAEVRGSQNRYTVELDWSGGELSMFCECPAFENGSCKHLWAAVLAAEARGYLSAVKNAGGTFRHADFDLVNVAPPPPPQPARPDWLTEIEDVANRGLNSARAADAWPAKRQILYVVDAGSSVNAGCPVLRLNSHDRKQDGSFTFPVHITLKRSQIAQLPDAADRDILSTLAGGTEHYGWGGGYTTGNVPASFEVRHPLAGRIVPEAIATGRCYLRMPNDSADRGPLVWDDGAEWEFALRMHPRERTGWQVVGILRRGAERMKLSEAALVTPGFVFTGKRVAPLTANVDFAWVEQFRRSGALQAPERDGEAMLATLLCAPGAPPLEGPEELPYEPVSVAPRPRLHIKTARPAARNSRLRGELFFEYGGRMVDANDLSTGHYETEGHRLLRRDAAGEKAARRQLEELGLRNTWSYDHPQPAWEIAPSKLPRVVRALAEIGWHIEAEGKVFRRPGEFRMEVSSGVDWFELHGDVDFGETKARLPQLLEALRRGEKMVRLDDGTYGLLPEDWLGRIGVLAGMGQAEDGHIRFRRTQAGLLDALLATAPEVRCDEVFTRVREQIRQFQGIEAAQQPAGFAGQLREYQREGLGWIEFLRRFSFGGCLADDMGVGKTAQVLALLETRRTLRAAGEPIPPSLVVVPRSLVFNWKQEAERFTPQLRTLDYTGAERDSGDFSGYDIVLTTYGTLRRDILQLKDFVFDYVVLDEAQAIKNAGSESAKAARLLNGGHRLALSGTPVENHLGELWSLFEFLNPGMLGTATVFKAAGGVGRNPDEETRRMLAHGLRPFILRRTKEQVARELPPKTEQTIYCELKPVQRKLYNELRQHYRDSLLKRIDGVGLAKSKIQVLEALLRLRQAACHPGLIDPKRSGEASAKMDTLLAQLREVAEEGHKALVFSQFTSLLSIVRESLDAEGVVYEYLDGQTRDRQERVERFQSDPDCRLFLISLKAGGLGLNLTAAEYVFLLDPWWNPAVEAQAVDRAHRIGQSRQVFAYRLIARDTVEEKVLQLQKSKRDLAAAIIGEDNSLIRNLRREDLELLLS
ncbi:MAG TPA: SNF2-related protein [Bryobacteraceae bacterium]|nr:SNF2-related protein [Bryobacteraceae bacterium]